MEGLWPGLRSLAIRSASPSSRSTGLGSGRWCHWRPFSILSRIVKPDWSQALLGGGIVLLLVVVALQQERIDGLRAQHDDLREQLASCQDKEPLPPELQKMIDEAIQQDLKKQP